MAIRTSHQLRIPAILPLVFLLLLATSGCEINSPEMPSFESTFVLPLGTERLEVMDAIEDEEYLLVAADGSLGFQLDGDPDTLALDFNLSVDIPGQAIDQGLGNFALPAVAPLSYEFQLADIWAPSTGVVGLTTVVPAFPVDVTSSQQDIPDVVSATLSEGALTVTVTNNLPVPIGADSGPDQITMQLENPADGSAIAQIDFVLIPAGQTATQAVDLAGATLPDQVLVSLRGRSPGSSGQIVTVNGTDAITVEAAFTDLVVSAATAVVAAQTFSSSFVTDLPADYEITRAVITAGGTSLNLTNGMPIPCTAAVTWQQIRDLDGLPLSRSFDLAGGASASATLDFAGYLVQAGAAPLTSLDATVEIVTPGSDGLPVQLSATDGLTATLASGAIEFSSVTGVVPAFTVPLDPITESIDLPDEMAGLELTAANLRLTVSNSAGIPADLDLTLTGTAADGAVRTLTVNEEILPAVGRAVATSTILLDQTNSGILAFLNNLPETITLAGDVVAGGGGATGTVHNDDFAVVSWQISAPVEIVINDATIDSEPADLDLESDLRERIGSHARGAVLRTQILNHLPLAVQLRIVAAQDTNQIAANPLLVIGPVSVAAALIDPTTHTVSQAVTSSPVVTLTEAQARVFGLPGLFTQVQAFLPSTDGQPVRVMATDFLEFQGVVELEVLIDDEL